MSIWLTSDLHIGHDKDFVWGERGFSSVDEMNRTYIKRINSLVKKDDDLYILGDVIMGDSQYNINFIKQINCKVHIICGNHDSLERRKLYCQLSNVVEVTWSTLLKYNKYNFYLSHFPSLTENGKEPLKQMVLNLHGHTHQKNNFYEDKFFMYHVGVDSHNGFPVLLDDIIKEIKEKYYNEKV